MPAITRRPTRSWRKSPASAAGPSPTMAAWRIRRPRPRWCGARSRRSAGSTSWSTMPATTGATPSPTPRSRISRNVLDVHLTGTFLVTQAAWPILAARRYGRIVFTTSQVGFYGKVDSVAYGAAKMGLVGLMHGLRLSAEPLGIKVNCISPFALTRLGDIFPKDIADYIDPAQVAAAVALLAQRGLSGLGRDRDRRRRAFRDRAHAREPRHRHRRSGRGVGRGDRGTDAARSPTCAIRCSIRTRSRRSARRSRG